MQFTLKRNSIREKTNSLDDVISQADFYSSYALMLTDMSRNILQVNDKFIDVFQYDFDEIIGKNPSFINSGTHRPSFYRNIWNTIESGKVFTDYINTKRKDGIIIRSRLKIIPVKKSSNDYQFLCLYDPLDEEDSFNLDLSESYKILLELTEKTPDIICIKDGDGKWLLANEANLTLFNLKNVDYRGKTNLDLSTCTSELYESAFLTCMESDELCWEKGVMTRKDETIPIPNGEDIVLDIMKVPVFNSDGTRNNLIIIGRDVSKDRSSEQGLKKALLKAEESDRLKSTFLATMSHELRTPLNSVLGFSSLILYEGNMSEVHEYARIINNNGQMLLNLIEDLFDVSLIESNQMQIKRDKTDIIKTIREVYEIFPMEIHALDKLDLDFSMELPYDELSIITDGFRVKQILTNLLRNALKFTDEGYITISLEIKDDNLLISVEDSGIGIQSDKINSLFNVFQQGEAGLNRKFGGAGIGLGISKKLALLLGGDLTAISEINKGSRFTLAIPFEK
jgi:PAS domain S-box-containing protein